MPNALEQAQDLFEAGSVDDAAELLHRTRGMAGATCDDDLLARVDDLTVQMRAYLNESERRHFDKALEPRKHTGKASDARLVLWLITVTLLGLFIVGFYGLDIAMTCFMDGNSQGGKAESGGAATLIGVLLWLATCVAGACERRRLALLLFGFVALYVSALFVLAAMAPAIWGPLTCT